MCCETLLKKSFTVKVASNGKEYGELVFRSKTKEIEGKLWNITEEQKDLLGNSIFVRVEGNLQEYNGKKGIVIKEITKVDENKYNIDEYLECYDGEEYHDFIRERVAIIGNEEIEKVVTTCLDRYESEFKVNVAAEKFHHDLRGGLAYHTATVLKAAEAMCDIYLYLNRDLIIAGVVLHDLLKCKEIVSDELGLNITYSNVGRLIGHINMGVVLMENICKELNVSDEVKMLLQHLVLSHHGKEEWGSPVKPMIPEAQVIHYMDKLDADLFNFERTLKGVNVGEFSDKVFQLENRRVYKPNL